MDKKIHFFITDSFLTYTLKAFTDKNSLRFYSTIGLIALGAVSYYNPGSIVDAAKDFFARIWNTNKALPATTTSTLPKLTQAKSFLADMLWDKNNNLPGDFNYEKDTFNTHALRHGFNFCSKNRGFYIH